jgi:hypothetical protein
VDDDDDDDDDKDADDKDDDDNDDETCFSVLNYPSIHVTRNELFINCQTLSHHHEIRSWTESSTIQQLTVYK